MWGEESKCFFKLDVRFSIFDISDTEYTDFLRTLRLRFALKCKKMYELKKHPEVLILTCPRYPLIKV